jgi:hypothetical protein
MNNLYLVTNEYLIKRQYDNVRKYCLCENVNEDYFRSLLSHLTRRTRKKAKSRKPIVTQRTMTPNLG